MRLVPLTKGLFAKVDDADFELVRDFNWQASTTSGRISTRHGTAGSACIASS